MNTWFDLWRAHFSRLTDEQVHVWEQELDREIHDLKQDEIIEAVRTMSRDDRVDHPHLRDLRIAIYRKRKGERGPTPSRKTLPSCAHCNGGWTNYYPAHPDPPYHDLFWLSPCTAVPCRCSSGMDVFDTAFRAVSPKFAAQLKDWGERAIKQQVERSRQEAEFFKSVGGWNGMKALLAQVDVSTNAPTEIPPEPAPVPGPAHTDGDEDELPF